MSDELDPIPGINPVKFGGGVKASVGALSIFRSVYAMLAHQTMVLPRDGDTYSFDVNGSGGSTADELFIEWQGRLVVFIPTADVIVRAGKPATAIGQPVGSETGRANGLYVPAETVLGPVLIHRDNAASRWLGKTADDSGEVWCAAVSPPVPVLSRLLR